MIEELRKVGIPVDNDKLTLIVLHGLDQTFDSFITTHMARIYNISFSVFLGLLYAYVSRLQHALEFGGITSANIMQTVNPEYGAIIWQICGKKGHSAIVCFKYHNEQCFPTQYDKSHYRNKYKGAKLTITVTAVWCSRLFGWWLCRMANSDGWGLGEVGILVDDGELTLIALNGLDQTYDSSSQHTLLESSTLASWPFLVYFVPMNLNYSTQRNFVESPQLTSHK